MNMRADADSFRQIAIFRDCDPVALQILAFAAERQPFLPGEAIISQGAIAKSAYFMMSGSAAILNKGDEIATAEPGSLLGELAMISGSRYSVSAIAKGPATAARIDKNLFIRVAEEYPGFGQAVMRAIVRRLDQSVREFDSVRGLLVTTKGFSDL